MDFNRVLSSNALARLSYEDKNSYFEWLLRTTLSSGSEDSDNDKDPLPDLEPEEVCEFESQLLNEADNCSDIEQETTAVEVNVDEDDEESEEEIAMEEIVNELSQMERHEQLEEYYYARDGTKWNKNCPPSRRFLEHNIANLRSGPTAKTKNLTIVDTFALLITTEIKDIILRETNRKAKEFYKNWNQTHPTTPQRIWKPVDEVELNAYIGILLFAGVSRSNHEHITDLWKVDSHPFYRAAMGLRRFQSISRFIRFDNGNTRAQRLLSDKIAPISDIWLMLNSNLKSCYSPGIDLTVDEQLFPFRGRTRFTQYIPSKPANYGIKIWWVCDAHTSYTLKGQIYTGAAKAGQREINQGERVVKELVADFKGTGRNVICDNFFTSLSLAKTLMLEYKLSILGTVNKKRRFIPSEFLIMKGQPRAVFSSEFGFADNVTLCSYVAKSNKCVILLSTSHYSREISTIRSKPVMICDYNQTKGGVDNMDKMLCEYTCKRRTKRRPLALFFNALDISALASYIINRENNKEVTKRTDQRRKFLQTLCRELIMPAVLLRSENSQIIRNFSTRNGIESILRSKLVPRQNEDATSEGRDSTGRICHKGNCYLCEKRRSTRKACTACDKPVCAQHSVDKTICKSCIC